MGLEVYRVLKGLQNDATIISEQHCTAHAEELSQALVNELEERDDDADDWEIEAGNIHADHATGSTTVYSTTSRAVHRFP